MAAPTTIPKLAALIGKTVDRLVAASDRPDQAYRVTILNSGAVNAFALPTGQLYVTRGLIALASDTSELSSVLSHEMAHVLAKHASIREDQARQAAVVTRVVTDMSNDPDLTALALAKTKLTMASFSRAQEFEADGIGVGISAKRPFRSLWRGALPGRDGAQRGAEGRQDLARSARAGFPVLASGDARARAERAELGAGNTPRRRAASATAKPISPRSTTSSMARTPAKVLCAAGASCIRSSASPSRPPKRSRWITPRRR